MTMLSKTALAGAFALAALTAFAPSLAAEELRVPVGGQKILRFDAPVARIAVGDPAALDVAVVSAHEMKLLGLKAGTTDVSVWLGDAKKSEDYHVTMGADLAGLESALASEPDLAHIVVSETPTGIVLKGDVASLDAKERALQLAAAYAGKNVTDLVGVAARRMVAVEVRFAAVSTSALKALGINFQRLDNNFQLASAVPNSVTKFQLAGGALALETGLPLSQAFNLFLSWPGADFGGVISALNSANLAQLLAEPTLIARSGEPANFLAGGEIPIPVPQSGSSNGGVAIEYKKFGVQLNLLATVLDDDRIVIKVNPEVSELDFANALTVQGFNIPAIRTRSANTTIELGSGQSFVLAGMMYSTSSNVEEKLPGLGDLPVLGTFFKRTQNSREQQELIIVATPRLVSPLEAGAVPPLPGESGKPFDPDLSDTLLNTRSLADYVVPYGLTR